MKKFDFFYTNLLRLVYLYLLGLIIFGLSRLIFILSFSDFGELLKIKSDFIKSLIMGFRVDSQVLMYALAIPLVLILISPLFVPHFISTRRWEKSIQKFYITILFLFILVLIGNYYFYQQFKSNYNPLVYAFFEDDTAGIMGVVWKEYPIILIFLILGLIYYILFVATNFIYKKQYQWPFGKQYWKKAVFVFFFLVAFFVTMRGSLGLFPLGENDLIVSNNHFLNTISSNGVLSFKYAIKNGKKSKFKIDIPNTMHQYGFSSPEEALSVYLDRKIEHASPDLLYSTTPKDSLLENEPPNVVFILMESMGDYYFNFHTKKMNLLGALEPVLDSLYVFHNFLPKGPRTIQSLEGLIINNPRMQALAQGLYAQKTFLTSNIKPFKDKKYHTVYATGGELGWRNVGNFFKKQFFDEVQGDFYIENKYPDAKGGDWGIYDEYLFKSVLDQLKENSGTPQFFFVMTTTNHPPYEIPSGYPKYPLEVPDNLQAQLIGNKKSAYRNFVTFQYANDQLGHFIDKLIHSPLAKNTIVFITGDHTNTEFFNFKENEKFKETAVPLFMYIPKKYVKHSQIDSSVTGSHKDIFPTLYRLALSNVKYVNAGDNLLKPTNPFGVALNGLEIFKEGAAFIKNKPVYYQWGKHKTLRILKDSSLIPLFQYKAKKAQAYKASMDYLIQKELQEH